MRATHILIMILESKYGILHLFLERMVTAASKLSSVKHVPLKLHDPAILKNWDMLRWGYGN